MPIRKFGLFLKPMHRAMHAFVSVIFLSCPNSQTRSASSGNVTFSPTLVQEALWEGTEFHVMFSDPFADIQIVKNLTGWIESCPSGMEYKAGIGCENCPLGMYSFDLVEFHQRCQKCPKHVQCFGSNDVRVENNFWTYPRNISVVHAGEARARTFIGDVLVGEKDGGFLEVYRCPYNYCSRSGSGVRIGGSYCREGSNRDPRSPVCGSCLSGHSLWDFECVPCKETSVVIIIKSLLIMWAFALVVHVLAQGRTKDPSVDMLFFTVQIGSLMFYPAYQLLSVSELVHFAMPSFVDTKCPFAVDGMGVIGVRLVSPLIYLAFVWLTFASHVLVAYFFSWIEILCEEGTQCCRCCRVFVVIGEFFRNTAKRDSYVKTTVALFVSTYQGFVATSLSFFICSRVGDAEYVLFYPDVQCYVGELRLAVTIESMCLAIMFPLL